MLSVGNGHVKVFFCSFFIFVGQKWYTIVYNSIEICIVRFGIFLTLSNIRI